MVTKEEDMIPNKQAILLQSEWEERVENFEDLGLKKDLLRGIYGYGFEKPSSIQQRAILPIIKGRDVIAQAQSGTGKTATFTIGILHTINPEENRIQAMVLVPTRELASSIYTVFQNIGQFLNLKVHLCIGGTNVTNDRKILQDGVHICIGTPGRILYLINNDFLDYRFLKTVVLDEADELFSRGFIEEIYLIFKAIPSACQICLFSATMPPDIIKMTEQFMNNPTKIEIKYTNLTLNGIKQFFVMCIDDDIKFESIIEILSCIEYSQCIIYSNKREKAELIASKMRGKGIVVSWIDALLPGIEKTKVLNEFRSGASRIIISSDNVVSNNQIQAGLVINFDLPSNKEQYIERIGWGGAYGRRGVAINLIMNNEVQLIKDIQQYYNTNITQLPDDLSEAV